MTDEADELLGLEESLWRPPTRFDRAHMEAVLAPDFVEFGRSGRVYTREEILDLPPMAIEAELRDCEVARVADGVRLVTYVVEDPRPSNRSSLWVRTDGRWRLRFHQGTPR